SISTACATSPRSPMSPSGTSTGSASVNKTTDPGQAGDGAAPVLAVVSDLFFVARIREAGRLAAVRVEFPRTPAGLAPSRAHGPRLVLTDRPSANAYERPCAALAGARAPVLGFTTHALGRQTQPWHARCDRVVTKETLTQELPRLLKEGVSA